MTYHGNALCQAALLEGMKRGDETRLESRIRSLVTHNGMEFTIDTLKVLKEHTIDNLDRPSPYFHKNGAISIRWDRKNDKPKGELGLIYTTWKKPTARLRAIGALINSFELDAASPRQIDKFIDSVTSRVKGTDKGQRIMNMVLPDSILLKLEANLVKRISQMEVYSAKDLSASMLPDGILTTDISKWKRTLGNRDDPTVNTGKNSRDIAEAIANLDKEAINQFYTAPLESRRLINTVSRFVNKPELFISPKIHMTPHLSRTYEEIKDPRVVVDPLRPYIGTIGMLQQPGGKLRTVVNVNRFVNYTLDPYAKALEDTFYKFKPIGVSDQNRAMSDVQQWLKQGHALTSLDLSSATDLLDFKLFTRGLRRLGDQTPMLKLYTEYFETMSHLPMYVPDLNGSIQYKTGQPLGMKGSFQTLTAMNFLAGHYASRKAKCNPSDTFRVVGDDFICKSEIASHYNEAITEWAGKTNLEKSLESSKYGEFLSHIMTRDTIHLVKPKYRPGYQSLYINAEKTTIGRIQHCYRLSKQDKALLASLAVSGDPSINNASDLRGPVRLPQTERRLISEAKQLIASFSDGGVSTHVEVSPESLLYAPLSIPDVYAGESRETDRRIYITDETGNRIYTDTARGPVHLDKGEFTTSIDKFDHKLNKRVARQTERSKQLLARARSLAKQTETLVNAMDSPSSEEISLGNGMSAPVEDLVTAVAAADDFSSAVEQLTLLWSSEKGSSLDR